MKHLSEEELQMLADGELDSSTRAAHLGECESCRERYDEIVSVVAFLEQRPDAELSPGFAAAVAAEIVKSPPSKPLWRRIPVVATLIGLLAFLAWLANNSLGTVLDLAAYDLYTADVPSTYVVALVVAIVAVLAVDAVIVRFGHAAPQRRVRHS